MLILKKCCALPFILLSLNIQASSPIEPSETALAIASVNGYTIAKIDNCGQGISAGKNTFAIFADYDGAAQNQSLVRLGFSGWNHSANENAGRPEWARLQHKGANYNFSGIAEVNESCNRLGTINMVLVKKVADWTMQHMNGFERDLSAQGYTFGDLASVVVDVKINREKTSIPSLAGLKSTYAPYLNAAAVAALDEGKVNIGFTLGGADKVNATVIVQLDQASLAEQWLRLTIPLAALSYYREVNYQRTETRLADVSRVAINRLLVVGETKSGGVLRSSISPWAASVPEGFKEMDVSFKKIEFQLQ